jgi:coenzyme F420-0:L-glutamate ligase/coenzyme F420-1:gamma-L-glutamate ligase
MDLTEIVKSRRSIRKFKPRKIPRETLRSLIDLARWSPSAHNTQPWRLIVVDDTKMKARLAKEMSDVWISDLVKDGVEKTEAEERVKSKNWNRVTSSSAVIMVCLDKEVMHKHLDPRRRKVEYLIAVQSVAAYIQTLLLISHDHGLGTCWTCTPLFCPRRVQKILELPNNFEPQAMVMVGFPAEKPSASPRKAIDEICSFNSWLG